MIAQPLSASPPLNLANPPTEAVRRDNILRERVVQPEASAQSASERGLGAERERNRLAPEESRYTPDSRAASARGETTDRVEGRNGGNASADNSESRQGDASSDERGREEERGRDGGPPEPRLSEAELQQLSDLQARDREVRTHEQAHLSAGGQYAGAMQLEYQRGPDGRRYAVGGEVSIDTGVDASDPEGSIAKLQTVRNAALAPAEPSAQDRRVAASASAKIAQLRAEIARRSQQDDGAASGSRSSTLASAERSDSPGTNSDAQPVSRARPEVSTRALRIELYYLTRAEAPSNPRIALTA